MNMRIYLIIILSVLISSQLFGQNIDDEYMWLEDIDGQRALDWVKAQNKRTVETLRRNPKFNEIDEKILKILNSDERIAYPEIKGDYVYNFWQDDDNERGLWRRARIEEYLKDSTRWETVLDIDALSRNEGVKWSFKGATFLYPDFNLSMVSLSRGGGDAVEIREFDLQSKQFVDNGYFVPEAKGDAYWIDRNKLVVSSDFGEGSLTTSGYPRMAKVWMRGTSLSEAKTIFSGEKTDVGVFGVVQNTPERQYVSVIRLITFYSSHVFVQEGEKLIKLDIPEDANYKGFFKNQLLIELKSDWNVNGEVYKQGCLLGIDYKSYLNGDRDFKIIFFPEERTSLLSMCSTRNHLILNKLNNINGELCYCSMNKGDWTCEKVDTPGHGRLSIISADDLSDRYFYTYENFLKPRTLYLADNVSGKITGVKSLPHFFNSDRFESKQFEAISTDSVRIPYFIVYSKTTEMDGSNPTLLYGYGGFEISMRPYYCSEVGAAWLENGGIYVLSNIRGGGEFGPQWHQAALKEKRQIAFDDFISVAEDLIQRDITSPEHLGISGYSNGGLLVGVAYTQRPDLYKAVICGVPLLDMKRYNKLLAGASWMAEYGDPDVPEEWEYIKKYSPYHNLVESKKYPKVLFTTTTRDDRVHPGHARKMAAKMESQRHDFFYFENTEGGHGAGVTNEQRALMKTIEFTYLLEMLK